MSVTASEPRKNKTRRAAIGSRRPGFPAHPDREAYVTAGGAARYVSYE
jgi:hypothetical protein